MEKLGRRFTLALFFAAKINQHPTKWEANSDLIVSLAHQHHTEAMTSCALPCPALYILVYGILLYAIDVDLFRFMTHILFHFCTTLYTVGK